ncbi:hypothetical protein Purlil1_12416 [Purpureocillium lilacinum]|uniref:Uncharacterized protein n=1 Tax=Purpureocillium lilacinum TaxID=33203 RepID=A0ABR0BHF8_PURLI|nr:hypothetical protein Purlil1_12416 [Purpureocillium lilacinum]
MTGLGRRRAVWRTSVRVNALETRGQRKFAGLQRQYRRPLRRQTRPNGPPHSQGLAASEVLSGPSPSTCMAARSWSGGSWVDLTRGVDPVWPRLPFPSQDSEQAIDAPASTPFPSTFPHQGHNVGSESNNDEDEDESEGVDCGSSPRPRREMCGDDIAPSGFGFPNEGRRPPTASPVVGRRRRRQFPLLLAGDKYERAAVDLGGARCLWPGGMLPWLPWNHNCYPPPYRDASRSDRLKRGAAPCRRVHSRPLMSDEKLRGGGRSLLIRKHALSVGTEKRRPFPRFPPWLARLARTELARLEVGLLGIRLVVRLPPNQPPKLFWLFIEIIASYSRGLPPAGGRRGLLLARGPVTAAGDGWRGNRARRVGAKAEPPFTEAPELACVMRPTGPSHGLPSCGKNAAQAWTLLAWKSEGMRELASGLAGRKETNARRAGYLTKVMVLQNNALGRWVARVRGVRMPANDGGPGGGGGKGASLHPGGMFSGKKCGRPCRGQPTVRPSQLRRAAQGTAP